jgi:hypothetical protein
MAWCFHKSQTIEEGYVIKALCKDCLGQNNSEEEDEGMNLRGLRRRMNQRNLRRRRNQ